MVLLTAALVCGLAAPALVRPISSSLPGQASAPVVVERAPPPQRLDMTEANIVGVRVSPTWEMIKAPKKPHRRNLIELRSTFRPELAGSVGAL